VLQTISQPDFDTVEPMEKNRPALFQGRHFKIMSSCFASAGIYDTVLPCDLEELMMARGLEVDHSTTDRWVLCYPPELHKRFAARSGHPTAPGG
jgi:hypothetical protein